MDSDPQLISGLWRLFPHTYADRVSAGSWKPYPYLKAISLEITRAVGLGGGRIIVELPVRHGKSTLISHWTPTWFLDLFPEKTVILSTYEAGFAAQWGRSVRNQIQNSPLVQVKIADDSSAANRWHTRSGGGMITAGIGGPITGRGGHLLICDDPTKNMEEALSPTIQRKTVEWFQSTFLTRAEPNATIILLMTRWTENDLAGWVEQNYPNDWKILRFPALAEPEDPFGRAEGEPLCSERYDRDALEQKKREVGSRVWAALYQQRPAPEEGTIFKKSWLRFYDQLPVCEEMIQSWDLSFSDGADASFVVGQLWARKGADYFLVDQRRERLDFVGTIGAIRDFSAKYPQAWMKLIEERANGAAVLSTLRHEINGLVPVQPDGSKEARAIAVSPLLEAGNVYFPKPELFVWMDDFLHEICSFPSARNDDQVDAMTQALRRLKQCRSDLVTDLMAAIEPDDTAQANQTISPTPGTIVCRKGDFPEEAWMDAW